MYNDRAKNCTSLFNVTHVNKTEEGGDKKMSVCKRKFPAKINSKSQETLPGGPDPRIIQRLFLRKRLRGGRYGATQFPLFVIPLLCAPPRGKC